ncbi:MAG: hypothetical protein JWR77_2073 [Rhizorhabdus sp.]|nr:hypothetical protein [Rhizorhabdus sp.]
MVDEDDVIGLARMAGLAIDPAYLAGVTGNLRNLLDQAALLFDPPIDPLVEPAPVFHP